VDVNDKDNTFSLREDQGDVVIPSSTYMWVKSQPSKHLRSLLQASLESRLFVKENYQLAFGTNISPPQTYFDFKRDTLLMDWYDFEI
jgi:hypothetical protein